jgi:hypothetical protein
MGFLNAVLAILLIPVGAEYVVNSGGGIKVLFGAAAGFVVAVLVCGILAMLIEIYQDSEASQKFRVDADSAVDCCLIPFPDHDELTI